MANLNLNSASKGLRSHNYSPYTIGSLDFGDLICTRFIETAPSDEWNKISCKGALRLAPMVFPPYGRCFLNSAAFFVPHHQIFASASSFHTQQTSFKGTAVKKPWFSGSSFLLFFSSPTLSTVVHVEQDTPAVPSLITWDYDFIEYVYTAATSSKAWKYRKLTRLGQKYYKILKSLGYDFPSYKYDTNAGNVNASVDEHLDGVTFLSYLKVYCDMFLAGQFYNDSLLVYSLELIKNNQTYTVGGTTYYNSGTGEIHADYIRMCLDEILVPHKKSNYLNAWNQPGSPYGTLGQQPWNSSSLLSPYMSVVSSHHDALNSSATCGAYLSRRDNTSGTSASFSWLSGLGLRAFEAWDKFVRRWNLSGSKSVQKIYAEFGVKSDDYNSNFVHKLFESSTPIDFSPVMSNSDTSNISGASNGKVLGAYAGMGVAGLNFQFDYKCADHGCIIVLSWLQINPILPRGMHPHVLRDSSLDYYTPEFDGKALRAIPACEISVDKVINYTNPRYSTGDKTPFGFFNLYDDYRFMRDNVFGDFVNDYTKNFYFGRDLSVIRETGEYFEPQSKACQYFAQGNNGDMTDPFQLSSANGDRFYLFMIWEINSKRAMLSDEEAYDLTGAGDTVVPENGNMVD